jgi:cytochrome c oxidase subunit 2
MRSLLSKAFFCLALLLPASVAFAGTSPEGDAQKTLGAPYDGQLGLASAASTIKVQIDKFHNILEVLMFAITVFVFALLAIVIVRFRAKVNPVASTRTHNTPLEVLWTIIPVFILLVLAFPSTKLLYYIDKAKNPEMTVKVTGHQWYWGYEFPDQKIKFSPEPGQEIAIDEYPSNIVADKDLKAGQIRLLSVDQPLVLPVDTEIQFLISGSDVIHSWYVPSLGINRSAVPGRTNESWARATHEGVFYGQCTKICGVNHGYMPIEVHVVSKAVFSQWAAIAKSDGVEKANAAILGTKTASIDNPGTRDTSVAAASQQ